MAPPRSGAYISITDSVVHDKTYYSNAAELNCTWEDVCEWEWQEGMTD